MKLVGADGAGLADVDVFGVEALLEELGLVGFPEVEVASVGDSPTFGEFLCDCFADFVAAGAC